MKAPDPHVFVNSSKHAARYKNWATSESRRGRGVLYQTSGSRGKVQRARPHPRGAGNGVVFGVCFCPTRSEGQSRQHNRLQTGIQQGSSVLQQQLREELEIQHTWVGGTDLFPHQRSEIQAKSLSFSPSTILIGQTPPTNRSVSPLGAYVGFAATCPWCKRQSSSWALVPRVHKLNRNGQKDTAESSGHGAQCRIAK